MITIPKETGNLPNNVGTIVKNLDSETGEVTEVIKHFDAVDTTTRSGKVKQKLLADDDSKKGIKWMASYLKQNMFDKDNFFKLFQYAYTGIAGSSKALKTAVALQPKATKEVKN